MKWGSRGLQGEAGNNDIGYGMAGTEEHGTELRDMGWGRAQSDTGPVKCRERLSGQGQRYTAWMGRGQQYMYIA